MIEAIVDAKHELYSAGYEPQKVFCHPKDLDDLRDYLNFVPVGESPQETTIHGLEIVENTRIERGTVVVESVLGSCSSTKRF